MQTHIQTHIKWYADMFDNAQLSEKNNNTNAVFCSIVRCHGVKIFIMTKFAL